MIVAFRTAVQVLLQLICMDQFGAAGALDPSAKSILLGRLDFDLWLMSRKQSHNLEPL